MAAKAVIPFLVAMMLLTGVCNTLLTKYQDMQCVRNCDSPNPRRRAHFEQPVIQTAQMFIGEMGCWLVVGAAGLWRRYRTRKGHRYEALPAGSAEDGLIDRVERQIRADGDDGGHHSNSNSDHAGRADDEDEDDDEEASTDSPHPLAKSLTLRDDEGRMHMTGWKVCLLALPACCDIAGTTLMNVGLLFVAASIYQMTRGALVLFVGLFSVVFLKRKLGAWKWFSLLVVVLGVAVVGLAGALEKDDKAVPKAAALEVGDGGFGAAGDAAATTTTAAAGVAASLEMMHTEMKATVSALLSRASAEAGADEGAFAVQTVIGVLLIALAQIFTASQFVLEESIMEKYSLPPLKAVGWEGIWGFLVTVLGMVVLHFAYGRTDAGRYGYFDAREGLRQITHYPAIAISSVLIMVSIGGFNFFGLSVTRTVSATSRSTIDTCRTLFIWVVSLGLGWETFKWLQVVGFALLVYGTFLFNEIVRPPLQSCLDRRRRKRTGELLPEALGEHN